MVLGTGTSVGKTYVARGLGRHLALQAPNDAVGTLKPIETGMTYWPASDAGRAFFWSCEPPARHPLYSFKEPLTPYLAALREGAKPVELGAVVGWVEEWERTVRRSGRRCWALIESAGGAFSPVAQRADSTSSSERGSAALTNVDLWEALDPCTTIVVARDGLGTLHDVTATLEALAARQRTPSYVVMNAASAGDSSTGTNATVLRTLRIADPVAVVGHGDSDLSGLAQLLLEASGALP
jgi:dethiobiotin synthase